jgi:protein O-mannosyl-transferase
MLSIANSRPVTNLVTILLSVGILVILCNWEFDKLTVIIFDDPVYYSQNNLIRNGFSITAIKWAFTTTMHGMWHPLTWVSLLMDVEIFGDNVIGLHVTNLLLHLLNCILVACILKQLQFGEMAILAGTLIFGLHPMNSEAVYWISERKGLLAGVFFFSSILFYIKSFSGSPLYKLLACFSIAIGMLCKPIFVVIPALFSLYDVLFVYGSKPVKKAVTESFLKNYSLYALAGAYGLISLFVGLNNRAVNDLNQVEPIFLVCNMVFSYSFYIYKFLLPGSVSLLYLRPEVWDPVQVLTSTSILLTVAWGILRFNTKPLVAFGILFYVITLIPVSGILPIGPHCVAARYMYTPSLGLLIVILALFENAVGKTRILFAVSLILLVILSFINTNRILKLWCDEEALWNNVIALDNNNYIALNNAGAVYLKNGKADAGMEYFRRSNSSKFNGYACANLASTYLEMQAIEKAYIYSQAACEMTNYSDPQTLYIHARILIRQGNLEQAAATIKSAIKFCSGMENMLIYTKLTDLINEIDP